MKKKFDGSYNNMDTQHGKAQSVEVLYDVAIKRARALKLMSLVLTGSALLNLGVLFMLGYKSTVNPYVPYVVRISESGSVNGQILGQQAIAYDDNVIKFFLVDFIKKVRTIYKDKSFYFKQSQEKLAFVNLNTKNKLENFINTSTNTKILLDQGLSNEILIEEILKIDNGRWQLKFIERSFNNEGQVIEETKYNTVMYIDRVPLKLDMIEKNPLGLIITNMEFAIINKVSHKLDKNVNIHNIQDINENNENNGQ